MIAYRPKPEELDDIFTDPTDLPATSRPARPTEEELRDIFRNDEGHTP